MKNLFKAFSFAVSLLVIFSFACPVLAQTTETDSFPVEEVGGGVSDAQIQEIAEPLANISGEEHAINGNAEPSSEEALEHPVQEEAQQNEANTKQEDNEALMIHSQEIQPQSDGKMDAAQFVEQASNDEITHITLTNDISIADYPYIYREQPLTIEMGNHAFILSGDLQFGGNASVTLTGSGDKQPLIQIYGGSIVSNTDLSIVARADNATAVYFDAEEIRWSSEFQFGAMGAPHALRIQADGDHAVAVDAVGFASAVEFPYEESRIFQFLEISAMGEGGIGIRYEDTFPVCVRLSDIRAGGAAIEASNAAIEIDGSTVLPAPQGDNVRELSRIAQWGGAYSFQTNVFPYGIWTYVGETPQPDNQLSFEFRQYDKDMSIGNSYGAFPVSWEYDETNTGQAGVYEITGTPSLPITGVKIENLAHGEAHKIPWYVVEEGRTYLTHAYCSYWSPDQLFISVLGGLETGAEYVVYMRNTSEEDWSQLSDDRYDYNEWSEELTIYDIDPDRNYQFLLKVLDGNTKGFSNIIYAPAGKALFSAPDTVRIEFVEDDSNAHPVERPIIDEDGNAQCGNYLDFVWLLKQDAVRKIKLTDDIIVNDGLVVSRGVPVEIDAGDHSLILQKNLRFGGAELVSFHGQGDEKPVVVLDGGTLGGSADIRVAATADRAVAVQVKQPYQGFGGMNVIKIAADGVHSTAIHVPQSTSPDTGDGAGYLYQLLDISAIGEGGMGIRIEDDHAVTIRLCKIVAVGASVECVQKAKLQSCIARPAPQNAETVVLTAAWTYTNNPSISSYYNLYHYGFWIKPGGLPPVVDELIIALYEERENNTGSIYSIGIPIEWDFSRIDADIPGQYTVGATPTLPIAGLPIDRLEERQHEIPFFVAGEDRQLLTWAYKYRIPENSISISLWQDMEGASFRLWYRAGTGAWSYLGEESNSLRYRSDASGYSNGSIEVYDVDLDVDYQFRLELLDGPLQGESNILTVPARYEFDAGGKGGDRDGGDQEGGGQLPKAPVVEAPGKVDDNSGKVDRKEPVNEPETEAPAITGTENESINNTPQAENIQSNNRSQTATQNNSNTVQTLTIEENEVPTSNAASLLPEQIQDLLDENGNLVFIQDGIRLVLPGALVRMISLADGETLMAELVMLDENSFSIRLFAGDKEITGFGGEVFTVYVQYDTGTLDVQDFYCTNGQDTITASAIEDGMLVFELTRTGTYQISPTIKDSVVPLAGVRVDTQKPGGLAWLWAVIVVGVAVLSGLLLRRWKVVRQRG